MAHQPGPRKRPGYTTQLFFSLLTAALITLGVILLVTAKIGPGLDSEELHDRGGGDREQVDEDNSGPG